MSLVVHLLGRPRLEGVVGPDYQLRSRKSWALLAYLALAERPPSRAHLASLLFSQADDPVRALRWSLSELRRGLGAEVLLDGDPVVLRLPADALVDVQVLLQGDAGRAARLPGIGAELLEGFAPRDAPAFETWLLSEQHHVAAASEAALHDAALDAMAHGNLRDAVSYAVRAAALAPLDEGHQALLIQLYRMSGDDAAASRQYARAATQSRETLGVEPSVGLAVALAVPRQRTAEEVGDATIEAVLEAGAAAVSAGAVAAGVQSLRSAARLADAAGSHRLRVSSRLALADALVHSLQGLDHEGVVALREADHIAAAQGFTHESAQARAELGAVEFLRGRHESAELWLRRALRLADGSPSAASKALAYLGAVESDRGDQVGARRILEQALVVARLGDDPRREPFVLALLGRAALLQGRYDVAARELDASLASAAREHWLTFLPWPQSLRGRVQLARGDVDGAELLLEQAFARACHVGDPSWEGMAAQGRALVAEARGRTDLAFALLTDAERRCTRDAEPYVWLQASILETRCELGLRHGHPDTARWVDALVALTAGHGLRGLAARAQRLQADTLGR